MPRYKASRLKGGLHTLEVGTANKQIDVPCVAHQTLIDASYPGRNSMAADDRVWDAGLFEHSRGAQQPVPDFFHGPVHPLEREFPQFDVCHTTIVSWN